MRWSGKSRTAGVLAGAVIVAAGVVIAPPERHRIALDTPTVRLSAFAASAPGTEPVIALVPTCAGLSARLGEPGRAPTLLSGDAHDVSGAVRAAGREAPEAAERSVVVGVQASALAAPLSAAGAIYESLFIPAQLWMNLTTPIAQLLPPGVQQFWYVLVVIAPVVVAMLPVAVVLGAVSGGLPPLPFLAASAFTTEVEDAERIAEPSPTPTGEAGVTNAGAKSPPAQQESQDDGAASVDVDPVPAATESNDPEPVSAPVAVFDSIAAAPIEGNAEPGSGAVTGSGAAGRDEPDGAEADPALGRERDDEPSTPESGRDAVTAADGGSAQRPATPSEDDDAPSDSGSDHAGDGPEGE